MPRISYLYATSAAYFKSTFAVLHFLVRRHFTPVNGRNNCLDWKKSSLKDVSMFRCTVYFILTQATGRVGNFPDLGWEADWKLSSLIANWILLCKVQWEQGYFRGNKVSFQFTDLLISIHFKLLLYFSEGKKKLFSTICSVLIFGFEQNLPG